MKAKRIITWLKKHASVWTWKPEEKAPPVVGVQLGFEFGGSKKADVPEAEVTENMDQPKKNDL